MLDSTKVDIIDKSEFQLPSYATAGSAGLDLRANIPDIQEFILYPGERTLVPTGIFIKLPEGLEAQIRPRSGLALKHGITVLNTPGTIDSDFRGEIQVILVNLGKDHFRIKHGERICQMVIAEYKRIYWNPTDSFEETERGSGGFGHTGQE